MASADVCTRCLDNFVVNTKNISCKVCEKKYHPGCVKLKDSLYKALNDCDNVLWFCDLCIGMVNEKLNITRQIMNLERKTDELLGVTSKICDNVENTNFSEKKRDTRWSDVVKGKSPPLLIKPKDAKQNNSNVTKNIIAQKINPCDLSVAVTKVKTASQGSVLIECSDSKSLQTLKNIAVNELSENYDVEIPKLRKPKIIIIGVHEQHLENEIEFINKIKRQNCLNGGNDIEINIVKKYIPKNKKMHNVIMELTPDTFMQIMGKNRIFVGWDSYPVYEYISVLRCFKCCKYGHKAENCKQENYTCPLCSGNHKSDECRSNTVECNNCKYAHNVLKIQEIQYNHTVFDKKCVCYERALDKSKARIQYI